jgi:hypothetical protein
MRKLTAGLIALGLVFALGACGGDDDDDSSTGDDTGTSEQYEQNHADIVEGFVAQGVSEEVAECMWDRLITEYPELAEADDDAPPPDGYAEAIPGWAEDCKASVDDGSSDGGADEGS